MYKYSYNYNINKNPCSIDLFHLIKCTQAQVGAGILVALFVKKLAGKAFTSKQYNGAFNRLFLSFYLLWISDIVRYKNMLVFSTVMTQFISASGSTQQIFVQSTVDLRMKDVP